MVLGSDSCVKLRLLSTLSCILHPREAAYHHTRTILLRASDMAVAIYTLRGPPYHFYRLHYCLLKPALDEVAAYTTSRVLHQHGWQEETCGPLPQYLRDQHVGQRLLEIARENSRVSNRLC